MKMKKTPAERKVVADLVTILNETVIAFDDYESELMRTARLEVALLTERLNRLAVG